MAHKTVGAAVAFCVKEQTYRDAISVWRKDWERWSQELVACIDRTKYVVIDPPAAYTKNQLYIACTPELRHQPGYVWSL